VVIVPLESTSIRTPEFSLSNKVPPAPAETALLSFVPIAKAQELETAVLRFIVTSYTPSVLDSACTLGISWAAPVYETAKPLIPYVGVPL
jgi:hypothetical protein